jgi:hypothetical protein
LGKGVEPCGETPRRSKMDMQAVLVLKEQAEIKRIEALTEEVKASTRLKESQIKLNEKQLKAK